jgi:N-acetylneuraminic acid mutarotase
MKEKTSIVLKEIAKFREELAKANFISIKDNFVKIAGGFNKEVHDKIFEREATHEESRQAKNDATMKAINALRKDWNEKK